VNRAEKDQEISELRESLLAAPFLVLYDYRGSNVPQVESLRKAVGAAGLKYRVVKNTLCQKAIEGTDLEPLSGRFTGMTGVLFSGEDASATAKLVKAQLRENAVFVVRAGFFDGTVLDQKGVEGVADLPSREQLLANLLATLQAGPRQVLNVLQAPARDLVYVLSNYAAKLESGEAA
jgi:large subunit ribosomal protein L10